MVENEYKFVHVAFRVLDELSRAMLTKLRRASRTLSDFIFWHDHCCRLSRSDLVGRANMQ